MTADRAEPEPARHSVGVGAGPSAGAGAGAQRTRVVGVLGGIASGKSALARLIAGRDGQVIDADALARAVLASSAGVEFVRTTFGDRALDPGGAPDRTLIASQVFASPALRAQLESFTHPLVRDRIRTALEAARVAAVPRVVLDVPLLLENDAQHHLVAECELLVFVDADLASRDARAVSSRGWQPGEVARREAAQMPLTEKRTRAHIVIANTGSLEDLERASAQMRADLGGR